jgi:hypothetical protein
MVGKKVCKELNPQTFDNPSGIGANRKRGVGKFIPRRFTSILTGLKSIYIAL